MPLTPVATTTWRGFQGFAALIEPIGAAKIP
jgi:hypothetical protein